jgi:hypothetical protein
LFIPFPFQLCFPHYRSHSFHVAEERISKRELKEDALVTSYVKITGFYERNKKNISIAVTVVLICIDHLSQEPG